MEVRRQRDAGHSLTKIVYEELSPKLVSDNILKWLIANPLLFQHLKQIAGHII